MLGSIGCFSLTGCDQGISANYAPACDRKQGRGTAGEGEFVFWLHTRG